MIVSKNESINQKKTISWKFHLVLMKDRVLKRGYSIFLIKSSFGSRCIDVYSRTYKLSISPNFNNIKEFYYIPIAPYLNCELNESTVILAYFSSNFTLNSVSNSHSNLIDFNSK